MPSPEQRLDILHTLLSGIDHSISNVEIEALAAETHGFVGADLAALCNEAAMTSLRRHIKLTTSGRHFKDPCMRPNGFGSNMQASELHRKVDGLSVDLIDSLSSSLSELTVTAVPISPISSHSESGNASIDEVNRTDTTEEETSLKVTADDFSKAKMKVRPSAMREVLHFSSYLFEFAYGLDSMTPELACCTCHLLLTCLRTSCHYFWNLINLLVWSVCCSLT